MRMIVAVITGLMMALYFMYIAFPLLSTTHTNFGALVNATDPVIANTYALGSGFYSALPLVPILVGAFVVINYALKRDQD